MNNTFRGITSIHLCGRIIYVDTYPYGYGGEELNYASNHISNHTTMSDKQFEYCIDFFEQLIEEKKKHIEEVKDNKPIKDIITILCNGLNEVLKDTKYHAKVGYGKRNFENSDYYALLILHDDESQHGSIKISQDSFHYSNYLLILLIYFFYAYLILKLTLERNI